MRKFLCIKDMFYDEGELGFICGKIYTMNAIGVVYDESGDENTGFDGTAKEWVDEYFLELEYAELTVTIARKEYEELLNLKTTLNEIKKLLR